MSTQGATKRRGAQATDKPIKRTRVSRACDQCRIAREKCDGIQPTCSTCSTSRRSCTYTATVKKRGIQPGYIRALELALAYLFQHDPENETLINDKLTHGGSSSLLLSRDSKESNKLHKRWRRARFYTDVDKLLSGGEISRRDPSEESSSDSDEERLNAEEPIPVPNIQNRVSIQGQDGEALLAPQEQATSTPAHPSATQDGRLVLPLDSWKLFETYFTYTQCWFPVCEKHDMLKLSYSYPADGLALSLALPKSGVHAELWSVLAVASKQDLNCPAPNIRSNPPCMSQMHFYATARSLIPEEAGDFDVGHVKALLNLAIFNIAQCTLEAAWLLVANASRILDMMDQSSLVLNPRHKHTLYGCFILDSMLATHFDRRPYFRAEYIRQLGRINEDGLDEWQPWASQSHLSVRQQARTPVLALSSLNAMSDIVGLLGNDDGLAHNNIQQLKEWEKSLPPKLAHICATSPPISLTPPTVLLRLLYQCTALALTSSQSWLLRSLNLLEQAQDDIGWRSLPPILRCLLGFIHRRSADISSSHEIQSRLERLEVAMSTAWRPICGHQEQRNAFALRPSPLTSTSDDRPDAIPLPIIHTAQRIPDGSIAQSAPTTFESSLTGPLLMEMPATQPNVSQSAPLPGEVDARYSNFPSDLESFLDELASLDTTSGLETQPQFMQNLGFAPDASMADLFSEYIPTQSSTFMGQEEVKGVNLDHFGFYDEG